MTRPLPARPSLTHLKQQAQDLLHAYQAGDPAARQRLAAPPQRADQRVRLADAQRALALEYGCASWPKLKQQVVARLGVLAARAADQAKRQARQRAEQQRVQALVARVSAAAERGEFAALLGTLQLSKRDMELIMPALAASGHLTLIVDALLRGVTSATARVRFVAAQAMDHYADERCAAPLRALLHDPVPRVRWAALHSLTCAACKLTPLPAGDDLLPVLIALARRDPSIQVRRKATWELGQACADPRAEAALREALAQETDRVVRRNAAEALRRLTPAPADAPKRNSL